MGAELARVGVVRMRHVDGGSVKRVGREVKVWEGALVACERLGNGEGPGALSHGVKQITLDQLHIDTITHATAIMDKFAAFGKNIGNIG
jgi:hypothetical protein